MKQPVCGLGFRDCPQTGLSGLIVVVGRLIEVGRSGPASVSYGEDQTNVASRLARVHTVPVVSLRRQPAGIREPV